MEVKGEHKCFACNRDFEWSYYVPERNFEVRTVFGVGAIGAMTSKDEFEITVDCPNCHVGNKFPYKRA